MLCLYIGLKLYCVLIFIQKEAGIPKKIIKVEDIPGLSMFLNLAYWLLVNSEHSFATLGTYLLKIIWYNYNWKFGMLRMRFFLNVITGEAGWTPDQWGHSRFRTLNTATDSATNQKHLTAFMRSLLKASPKILLFSLSFSFVLRFLSDTDFCHNGSQSWNFQKSLMVTICCCKMNRILLG